MNASPIEAGKKVGKSAAGYKMCAVIILINKDTEQFKKDSDFVDRSVYVVTG